MNNSFDIKPLEVKYYLLAFLIGLPIGLIFTLPILITRYYFKNHEIDISIILAFIIIMTVLLTIFLLASIGSSRIRKYRVENNSIVIFPFLSKKIVIPFTDINKVSFVAGKDSIELSIIAFYAKDNTKLFSLSKDDYKQENIVKLLELLKIQNVEMSDQIEKFIRRSLLGL